MASFLPRWLRPGSRAPSAASIPLPLTLYTRPDCPLCEELKAELACVRACEPCELREVDVQSDPALERVHGRSIPVLLIGQRVVCKGRIASRELERRFARLARQWRAEHGGAGERTKAAR